MEKVTFNEIPHETKISMLEALQTFSLPNNPTFLHCGTLLGAVREHGLIPHDDDIDIAYLSAYHTKPQIRQEMLSIYKYLSDRGMLIKYFDYNYHDVFSTDFTTPGRGQAHILVGGYAFDLWTTWIDEDGDFNLFDMAKISKTPLPLVKSSIYGLDFDIPSNATVILEAIYGRGWEVPKVMKPEQKNILL